MAKWKFRSEDGADAADIASLIGEGTAFTGELALKGGARIDGRVVGRILAQDLLVVGATADIEAQELHAIRLTVCGTVRGKLFVEERIDIQPGGRVVGQIVMAREGLIVAPGGVFEGTVEYNRAGEGAPSETRALAIEAAV